MNVAVAHKGRKIDVAAIIDPEIPVTFRVGGPGGAGAADRHGFDALYPGQHTTRRPGQAAPSSLHGPRRTLTRSRIPSERCWGAPLRRSARPSIYRLGIKLSITRCSLCAKKSSTSSPGKFRCHSAAGTDLACKFSLTAASPNWSMLLIYMRFSTSRRRFRKLKTFFPCRQGNNLRSPPAGGSVRYTPRACRLRDNACRRRHRSGSPPRCGRSRPGLARRRARRDSLRAGRPAWCRGSG